MVQQSRVVLGTWKHVDGAPEAGPACEAAGSHVGGDQAGGGADGHSAAMMNASSSSYRTP